MLNKEEKRIITLSIGHVFSVINLKYNDHSVDFEKAKITLDKFELVLNNIRGIPKHNRDTICLLINEIRQSLISHKIDEALWKRDLLEINLRLHFDIHIKHSE